MARKEEMAAMKMTKYEAANVKMAAISAKEMAKCGVKKSI